MLSVSEFNDSNPYKLWGVEEMMANYIFEYFLDTVKIPVENISENFDFEEFGEWIQGTVADFYEDWKNAKKEEMTPKNENTHIQTDPNEENEKEFEHWWDLQIINESGLPVTHVLSFLDKESFYYMDETENVSQNITSMSISALKYVIDEHGGDWNIEYLKSKLNNEMGYQYTFFRKFSIIKENELINLMLIMNSGLFNLDSQMYKQILTGKEENLLELFANRLKVNSSLFSNEGLLNNFDQDQEKVHSILLECVEEIF